MKLTRFLGGYFKPYGAWGLVATVTILVAGASLVVLLSVFKAILSEVLLADENDMAQFSVLETDEDQDAAGDEGAEGGENDGFLGLGFGFDLTAMIDQGLLWLRQVVGVTPDNVVWSLPLIFCLIFLARSISMFVNGYIFQIIGLGATTDLRNDLYRRILHQSSRFYSQHPSGELVSRVSNDIGVMQSAISSRLLDLFQQSLTLIFLIWYLMSKNFQLTIMCLIVAPAVFYPLVRFGRGMRKTSHRSQERLADLSNLVAEAVRGHRVVKAFGMENFELDRFREATQRHLKVRLKAQFISYSASPVIETMAAFGGAVFLSYAGYSIRKGEFETSDIITFLLGLMMLYDPVRKLNKVNLILQEALAAAVRVMNVMQIERDVRERDDAEDVGEVEARITFENVFFRYKDDSSEESSSEKDRADQDGSVSGVPARAVVLRGVDLEIEPGEVVALIGSSGAGKSTLVNLLPRFYDPDKGRVTLGGHDLRDFTLASLRSRIGIVTQDTILFNDTIRNNIAYGRSDLSLEKVREAAKAAYADDFIMELPKGYDTEIGEDGTKLSGGQRQRLAIARALAKDPPILILDEATSHLDSEAEALVQKALYNLMTGRTALVIAHRLSTVQRANRILGMDSGKVVEEGTHEELLRAGGVYQRLYELQFQDHQDEQL